MCDSIGRIECEHKRARIGMFDDPIVISMVRVLVRILIKFRYVKCMIYAYDRLSLYYVIDYTNESVYMKIKMLFFKFTIHFNKIGK